jgi:glycerol-3-phosphate dehydrogenase (NAD(P)+)
MKINSELRNKGDVMGKIVVMGAGSWGTALARVIASKGHEVILWDYKAERAKMLQEKRINTAFLPNAKFPDTLRVTSNIDGLLEDVEFLICLYPGNL